MRRKTKVVHKAAAVDDKRLQQTFKRLNITPIPGIEEVRARGPRPRACRVGGGRCRSGGQDRPL